MDVDTEFTEIVDDAGILHGEIVSEGLEAGFNTHFKQTDNHGFCKEVLSKDADEVAIFLV